MKSLAALLVLSPLLVASCGDDTGDDGMGSAPDAAVVVDPPDAAPLSPICMEAAEKSDLAWIQENIFNSCSAFSVCHKGAAMSAGGLNLESGFSETAMVSVDSKLFPDYKLVVPGDPGNSYLMVILGAVDGPLKDGVGTMPYSNPILCQPKLDAVGRWISSL